MISRLVCGLVVLLCAQPAAAEVQQVQVATQYGFGFLPMMVIEHEHMLC